MWVGTWKRLILPFSKNIHRWDNVAVETVTTESKQDPPRKPGHSTESKKCCVVERDNKQLRWRRNGSGNGIFYRNV